MIVVHHLNNSRSQRVLWLLEELGLPYEIKHYQRNATSMLAPPELLAVHPLGKSPVITDAGVTLAETGAIVEYLLDQHGGGRLLPGPNTPEALRYRYWLHFSEGSMMPPLLLSLVFDRIANGPMPFLIRPVARGISTWFAGDILTGADIMMSFPIEAAAQRAGLDASRPRLMAFLQRIHARPAYLQALARGGPYAFA
jgi:glutathione S-transferase